MAKINFWKCTYCKEQNTDLKTKTKDHKIICPKCGKENRVCF